MTGKAGLHMKKEMEAFASNLKTIRLALGYSQAGMAERLGVARSTYAGYEEGRRTPDMKTFLKIVEEFSVSADELLGR